jgi:hypothetical protein
MPAAGCLASQQTHPWCANTPESEMYLMLYDAIWRSPATWAYGTLSYMICSCSVCAAQNTKGKVTCRVSGHAYKPC